MVAKLFSKMWKSSTQVRKQRKYNFNAPNHLRHKMLNTNLSKELRKELGFRSFPFRSGDIVKIMTGQFKGKSGKVDKVNLAKIRVYVEKTGVKRQDGSISLYPISPSNLQITKLVKDDELRVKKLEKMTKLNKKEVSKK
jgi:large subunit ribosomal protein L24